VTTSEVLRPQHEWPGRVWLNPPYSQPLIGQFCDKLLVELLERRTVAAITLTNNATETGWPKQLLQVASALCFPTGRVQFWAPGRESAALQGQMICYFGEHREDFLRVFVSFGPTERWATP
jgi:DNA N-6-adenine-methyltransferase Dam